MGQVIEFRNGRVIEHHEDDTYLDDAWAFIGAMNQIAWEWAKLPLALMEGHDMADVHVLPTRQSGETMKSLRRDGYKIGIRHRDGGGYDITAYRRETAHGSHERTQPVRFPRHWRNSGGDDPKPAA